MGDQERKLKGYIPQLDGLRAVSILAVMLGHAKLLPGGFIGVDIFFVISGYLITKLLLQEHETTGRISFRDFYARRCLRILPAFWFFLFAYLLAVLALSQNPVHREKQLVALLLSVTFTMNWARAFSPNLQDIIGHTWSLAIEEQFYLIWPFCLVCIIKYFRLRAAQILIAAIFVVAIWKVWLWNNGATYDRLYNGFDTRADAPLFGCLIALVEGRASKLFARFYGIPTLLLIFELCFIDRHPLLIYLGGQTIVAATSAWLLMALVSGQNNVISLTLSSRPLVSIGKISYGLYLWHPAPALVLSHNNLPIWMAYPAALAMAAFSYKFIERPFLTRKMKLAVLADGSEPAQPRPAV